MLGVLGAGLMASRKPKQSSVSADSGRGSGLRPTVDDMEFKETVVSKPIAKPVVKSVPVGKMRGAGNTDAEAIAAQKTRGDYAREAQINALNTAEGSPIIDNPYKAPVARVHNRFNRKDGGRAGLKSGGRVKGCGKALRGFGRAMKKGKK